MLRTNRLFRLPCMSMLSSLISSNLSQSLQSDSAPPNGIAALSHIQDVAPSPSPLAHLVQVLCDITTTLEDQDLSCHLVSELWTLVGLPN